MQPSDAELRAGAVAKLKRATSLPRIKGGRRPPMHPEGASEGEKSRDDASSRHGDDSSKNVTSDERDPQPPEPDESSDPQPAKRRRRSRSRSRSRSKDIKDLKPPTSLPPCDSSPEVKLGFLPAFDDIPVVSPTPSRPVGITANVRLPFVPPTAPSSPAPPGAVPTLQDLQQRLALGAGLFRSQSASRAATMLKLTGAAPALEPPQPSPSPRPSRSNTVTGSERAVARQRMIGRLQHRVGNQADDLTTSGGEDVVPILPKRRRRRSRRSSGTGSGAGASVIVDDREPTSTSPNTPIVPPSTLPFHQYPEPPHVPTAAHAFQSRQQPPPPPPPPVPPSPPPPEEDPPANAPESHPNPVTLQQWTFELGPPRRDDVVIEDDEEPSTLESESSLPQPSPSPPPRDNLDVNGHDRAPHTSDAPSSTTVSSGDVVPIIMSSDVLPSPYKEDVFPKSPFNTPLKERPRDEEEEEEIVYREEMKARRVWSEKAANGNGIKWPDGCTYTLYSAGKTLTSHFQIQRTSLSSLFRMNQRRTAGTSRDYPFRPRPRITARRPRHPPVVAHSTRLHHLLPASPFHGPRQHANLLTRPSARPPPSQISPTQQASLPIDQNRTRILAPIMKTFIPTRRRLQSATGVIVPKRPPGQR